MRSGAFLCFIFLSFVAIDAAPFHFLVDRLLQGIGQFTRFSVDDLPEYLLERYYGPEYVQQLRARRNNDNAQQYYDYYHQYRNNPSFGNTGTSGFENSTPATGYPYPYMGGNYPYYRNDMSFTNVGNGGVTRIPNPISNGNIGNAGFQNSRLPYPQFRGNFEFGNFGGDGINNVIS